MLALLVVVSLVRPAALLVASLHSPRRYGYWEAKLNKKIKETAAKEAAKAATVDTEASAVTTAALTPRDPETTSVKSENTAVAKEDHLDYTAGFGARPRALFLMAFTVVVREGLESVVFITGVGQANPVALILPGIVGIIIGVGVGVGLYYGAGRFRLDLFLKFSAAFLFVIAAGLAAGAAHEFEEYYFAVRPELGLKETTVLWDVCACCSHKENAFFSIAYALVGWRCVGTVATVTTYFTFWAVVLLGYVLMRWYKARLAARGELEKFEGEVVPAIEDVKANGQGQGVVAVAGMEEEVPEKAKVGSSL